MTIDLSAEGNGLNTPKGVVKLQYAYWKRENIENGLEQSHDRGTLVPAAKVWSDFGFNET